MPKFSKIKYDEGAELIFNKINRRFVDKEGGHFAKLNAIYDQEFIIATIKRINLNPSISNPIMYLRKVLQAESIKNKKVVKQTEQVVANKERLSSMITQLMGNKE